MTCEACIKGFELIELPLGSTVAAIKSARKAWFLNLHPDVWQNKPGWKGAAKQLTNINVAIDHLLQCDQNHTVETPTSHSYDDVAAKKAWLEKFRQDWAKRDEQNRLLDQAAANRFFWRLGFCLLGLPTVATLWMFYIRW